MTPRYLAGLSPLALLLAACASIDYVPDTGWEDNDWRSNFYEEWFGGQLKAAHEPPLAAQADLMGFSSRFRLLVLPSFSPAYVYRIDEATDETMILTFTQMDGAGGYDPGEIAVMRSHLLTDEQAQTIRASIEAAQLSITPLDHKPDEGSDLITICADGTRYVFERLSPMGRDFVTRHECELADDPMLLELRQLIMGMTS